MLRITHLFLAVLFGAAPALWAAPVSPVAFDDDEEEEEAEEDEDEDEKDHWIAVVGGDVHTGTGAVLRGATVVAKNGVIEEIGWDPWFPEEAEIVDAAGYFVYPGLIAMEAAPGIVQGGGAVEEEDTHGPHGLDTQEIANHLARFATEPQPTQAAIEDSYDPFGQNLILALATGITTTVNGDAAIKLKRREIDDIVMSEGSLQSFTWSRRNPAGKRALREKFERASEYTRELREFEQTKSKDDEEKGPSDKGVDKQVLAVLGGQTRAKFTANDRTDLLSLARFAQEFDFRPVIEGCQEGWTVADELGRAGATAILTPRDTKRAREELQLETGSTIENAAILYRHGVQIAVVPGSPDVNLGGIMGRDLLALPIEVGFAVRGGLPEEAGLASVTTVPARLLGISHRVGTLEEGKDCDLIVTDGDWMHYETFVQYTVVAGKLAYDKQEEVFFSHIRPRPVVEVEETEDETEPAETPDEETEEVDDDDDDDEGENDDEAAGDDEEGADEGEDEESEDEG